LVEFYEIPADEAAIERAVHRARRAPTRLNVGVSGRGLQLLTGSQRDAICRMAKLWQLDPAVMRRVGVEVAPCVDRREGGLPAELLLSMN
jgi:hypothetical protein